MDWHVDHYREGLRQRRQKIEASLGFAATSLLVESQYRPIAAFDRMTKKQTFFRSWLAVRCSSVAGTMQLLSVTH